MASVETGATRRARRRLAREDGQAMVEFALILPVFILLVAGIVQFGIALNFWLDEQRIANQGARWAVVNNWPPNCPLNSAVNACGSWPGTPTNTLQKTMKDELLTKGESNSTITVCYPKYPSTRIGDPVKVTLSRPFNVVGIPFLSGLSSISIRGSATMRLEQSQDLADYPDPSTTGPHITGAGAC